MVAVLTVDALTVASGIALALAGHIVLCVAIVNRLHSTGYHYRLVKAVEQPVAIWLLIAPPAWWLIVGRHAWFLTVRAEQAAAPATATKVFESLSRWASELSLAQYVALAYAAACCGLFVFAVCEWAKRRLRRPRSLLSSQGQLIDVAREFPQPLAGDRIGRWCAALPGNQLFQVELVRKTLLVPKLPAPLDGLTIAHLSDLHFTGRIAREYFEYQMDRVNEFDADLIMVTGDIVDSWSCFPWLATTLGRLRARQGRYFLLGNHDLRRGDPVALRHELVRLGFLDVGGTKQSVTIHGQAIEIYGNELPWFGPAPEVPPVAAQTDGNETSPFRILLSHAPDQIRWAVDREFPLMLAGHTHGGQIVFPILGPVVAPSRYGVKYAGGVFDERGVVMHVSRGMSGEEPLRWNCPPELPLLTLRRSVSSGN